MGLFDFLKKPKSDVEMYYEQRGQVGGQGTMPVSNENMNMHQAEMYSSDFRFTVEDVFTITGRGTVVTGKVMSGTVRSGETVTLQRMDGSESKVTISGIEAFRKLLDVASAGDHVGLLLRNITKNEIGRNDILKK